jgi:putative PEP-CTERM system TPR-repeat lipoprotein
MRSKVNHGSTIKHTIVLLCLLVLTGCNTALTPEEGLQRAEEYTQKGNYKAAIIELKNVLLDHPRHLGTRLKLSELYLIQRDGANAENQLLKARKSTAEDIDIRPSLGRALLLQGEFSRVIEEIHPEETDTPAVKADLQLLQAYAYLFSNDSGQAEQSFRQVLAIDNNNASALSGMAMINLGSGNYAQSAKEVKLALNIDNENMDAWLTRGHLALVQHDYDSAENAFRQAISMSEQNFTFLQPIQAWTYLVQILVDQKKLDSASQVVDDLAENNSKNPMVHYLRALIAYERGDYQTANEHIQVVRARAPDLDPALILDGAINFSLGNLERGNKSLSAYLARHPNSKTARVLLAKINLQLQQPEQAYELVLPLLNQEPENLELLLLAGSALSKAGKPAASIPLLERALQQQPDDQALTLKLASEHLSNHDADSALQILKSMQPTTDKLGQREKLLLLAWLQKEDYGSALTFLDNHLATHPKDTEALADSGMVLIRMGKAKAARERFETALALEPDNTRLLMELARLEYKQANYSQAEELLNRVLKTSPDDATAMFMLANLSARQGHTEQAITWLERTRAASENAWQPRLMLVKYYIDQGNLELAREISTETTMIAKNRADVWNTHSVIQNLTGDAEGAVKSLLLARQLSPNSETILMNLARSQVTVKDLAGARQSLHELLQLSADNYKAAAMLALIEMKQGNTQKAFEIARVQQSYPDNRSNALSLEGDLQMMAGKPLKAIDAYRAAREMSPSTALTVKLYLAYNRAGLDRPEDTLLTWLQAHPDDVTVRSLLARAYYDSGQGARAIDQYVILLSQKPDDPDTLNNLALAYYAQQNPRALQTAEKAYRLNSESAAIQDTLGWMLVQENKVSRGLSLLEEAVKQLPDNIEVQYHYAVALAESGDSTGAKTILQKIVDSGSNSPVIEDAKNYLQQMKP